MAYNYNAYKLRKVKLWRVCTCMGSCMGVLYKNGPLRWHMMDTNWNVKVFVWFSFIRICQEWLTTMYSEDLKDLNKMAFIRKHNSLRRESKSRKQAIPQHAWEAARKSPSTGLVYTRKKLQCTIIRAKIFNIACKETSWKCLRMINPGSLRFIDRQFLSWWAWCTWCQLFHVRGFCKPQEIGLDSASVVYCTPPSWWNPRHAAWSTIPVICPA